jgi:hypothetical protein
MGSGPKCPQCERSMAQAKGREWLCFPCVAKEQQRERRVLEAQTPLLPPKVIVPGARPLGTSFLAGGHQTERLKRARD